MYLKSLELNGFKSFAQKTVLEFPIGITAIVGPNGSGKSNVIDAIRWLLGEREARNLRGGKTEDLIFNGTPKRPRTSMAQAGLHFNNDSGFFPVDFKEVSILRRVGRDGASKYFLNKSEVRLKDIIDFFNRSRLGTKGLTIINQGSSDLFVRATNEERKIMIEEILGLREYQIKKEEAEKKLKNTFINLDKTRVMIEEVVPRFRSLKRQTNKWTKRSEIEKELADLENNYFSFKLWEIKKEENQFNPIIENLNKQIIEKAKELKDLEINLNKIESSSEESEDLKLIKKREEELLERRSQIQREFGRLEAKLEILSSEGGGNKIFKNEDLFNLINEIKTSLSLDLEKSDLTEFKSIVRNVINKIEDFLGKDIGDSLEIKELKKVKDNLNGEFDKIEAEFKNLEKTEKEITSKLEDFQTHFRKAFEAVENKKDELNKSESQKNRASFDKEKCELKLNDFKNQLSQIGRSINDFIDREVGNIKEDDFPEIERKMFKLRTELAAIGEIDEAILKEAQEVENHYNFLTKQSEDLRKATNDLKGLIKELNVKIQLEFSSSFRAINEEFNKFFRLMFGGGQAKLKIKNLELKIKNDENSEDVVENKKEVIGEEKNEEEARQGVEIELNLPKKRITSLEMLSGGEKSLVSIAALFALISISPPPFLVLDEIDAALDENNSKRFANLIKEFANKTQFIIVTHNRAIMESADILYGVTMAEDGTSKILSLKLEINV